MDATHKAAKILSGLIFLASILLLIDYYMPQQSRLLVVEDIEKKTEATGHISTNHFTYAYADGVRISESNFRCINFSGNDTIFLKRSAIYKLQTEITVLSGYKSGENCLSEYNPFVLRGLFILLPIIFAIGAIRSKEKGGAVVGAGVALAVYFADICSLFIL